MNASEDLVAAEFVRADPWVLSSLLQKSIRRGEVYVAERAAQTLLRRMGSAVWRRLSVIAFEDIGAGCPDLVVAAANAGNGAGWRKTHGGDERVLLAVTRSLAEAAKDRSADYLICAAKDHPSLIPVQRACLHISISERLRAVADLDRPLQERAVFAWYASGLEWAQERRVGRGDLGGLLDVYRMLGVPEGLVTATGSAAKRTREPITVMVPLVWLAASQGQVSIAKDLAVPATTAAGGVQLYALDKHTRLGRDAIYRFSVQNCEVQACLAEFVEKRNRRNAAYMAAFYTDAFCVSRRLMWDKSEALERLGTENDMLKVGVPLEGIQPLLDVFLKNLGHLNELRAEVFVQSQVDTPRAQLAG